MSSPRSSVVERLRLEHTSTGLLYQRSPPHGSVGQQHAAAAGRGADISVQHQQQHHQPYRHARGVSGGADDNDVSAQRVPLTTGSSSPFGLSARTPRTPSGFGISSHTTAPSVLAYPSTDGKDKAQQTAARLRNFLRRRPILSFAVLASLVLAAVWLVLLPRLPDLSRTTTTPSLPLEVSDASILAVDDSATIVPDAAIDPAVPASHPHGLSVTDSNDADAVPAVASTPVDQRPSAPSAPAEAVPTSPTKVTREETTTDEKHDNSAAEVLATPEQPSERSSHAQQQPQPPKEQQQSSDGLDEAATSLPQADLVGKELHCTLPLPERRPCDWSWGPPDSPRSPNSEDHTGSRTDWAHDAPWKKPEDFYTFQAGVHVSGEGTGVLVRIFQRDLCCTGPLPLAYFRVTTFGSAQAASNPPLALGPLPTALGRGHRPVHLSQRRWGRDIALTDTDEQRVLQTFVLLPDVGHYGVQVRLTHFNVSIDMISENYPMNSKIYNQRPGLWIDGFLKNSAREEQVTKLTIPASTAFTHQDPRSMPLCGEEGGGRLGGQSQHGTRYGMPLAGRWVFHPPQRPDPLYPAYDPKDKNVDVSTLDPRWLVEHSVWTPYFCRLDRSVPFARALEKVRWMHFTGDSNTRHMFYYVCEMANGTLMNVNAQKVPRYLDPPHLCIGPSSPDNVLDSDSGLALGSNARWVLTYTNWFWGKEQTLDQRPQPRKPQLEPVVFNFKEQCSKFVEQNETGLFFGWPHCDKAPASVAAMDGPGATYFGWGSHAAEMAANPATDAYFRTEDAFDLPYFRHHPTIFPLTTANTPSRIPDKFGRQQVMRNNERVHASNLALVSAVMDLRLSYATRLADGAQAHRNWVPLFDIFSPTYAAAELLAVDAVHFDKFFSYEEPKWLMHYIFYAPNFGANTNK